MKNRCGTMILICGLAAILASPAVVRAEGEDRTAAQSYLRAADERLKTGVRPADDPLSLLERLRGVHFKWKGSGKPAYGFIAQEVETVMPEAVTTHPQTGMKSVDYDQVIPVMVEVLKNQRARLKAMDQQLDGIEANIGDLESRAHAHAPAYAAHSSFAGSGAVDDNLSVLKSLLLYPGSNVDLAIGDACFRVSSPDADTLVVVPLVADSLEARLNDSKSRKLVVRPCASN